jgi:hypothetical protein
MEFLYLARDQCPKTSQEEYHMNTIPYASVVESLFKSKKKKKSSRKSMLCTWLDICYSVGMVSRNHSNPRPLHSLVVKDYISVSKSEDLIAIGYTDFEFQPSSF